MNAHDITTAVTAALGEHSNAHDVDGIVRAIIERYGLVELETIDHDEFWAIVEDHAVLGGEQLEQAAAAAEAAARRAYWTRKFNEAYKTLTHAGMTRREIEREAERFAERCTRRMFEGK